MVCSLDSKSKEMANMDTLNKGQAQNVVGFFLNMRKHQKNVLFHQYNKVGDFDKWIYGKIINPKYLVTDERIILSCNKDLNSINFM